MTNEEKRDLMTRLAERVMGWKTVSASRWDVSQVGLFMHDAVMSGAYYTTGGGSFGWNPLENIADAWMLVEALMKRGYTPDVWCMDAYSAWYAEFRGPENEWVKCGSISAQMAICLAADAATRGAK